MRKYLVALALGSGVGGIVWYGKERLGHTLIEHILTYLVGAQVEIGEIMAFSWNPLSQRWYLSLKEVRVGSTLLLDTQKVGLIRQVFLSGKGEKIERVKFQGMRLHLIRLGKGQKNFRFFPRRRTNPPPQQVDMEVDSLELWLENFPPGVFLALHILHASGRLEIESFQIKLSSLHASLMVNEVCIKGQKQSLPNSINLCVDKGAYWKKTDNWREITLSLYSAYNQVIFSGDITGWERLWGYFDLRLDSLWANHLLSMWANLPQVGSMSLRGKVSGSTYNVKISGSHSKGNHEFSLYGDGSRIYRINGIIGWHGLGKLYMSGAPESLLVWGGGEYEKLPWSIEGYFHWTEQQGYFRLIIRNADTIWIWREGREDLRARAQLGKIAIWGIWNTSKGLVLEMDSTRLTSLLEAFQPYQTLLTKRHQQDISISIQCRKLVWDGTAQMEHITMKKHKGALIGEGRLWLPFLRETADVKLYSHLPLRRGDLFLNASQGYVTVSWLGDSIEVSGVGRWNEVLIQGSGWLTLSDKHLWLRNLKAEVPGHGFATLHGVLYPEGANVEVNTCIGLSWLWQVLPLYGIYVSQGWLRARFCAEGAWDTLFRWDNPTEGEATLADVRGYFPKLGLHLDRLSLRLWYNPSLTCIDTLEAQIGKAYINANAQLQGTLGYLYTDWQHLRGNLLVTASGIALSNFWRYVEGGQVRRRVYLPRQMELNLQAQMQEVDLYGIPVEEGKIYAHLQRGLIEIDTLNLRYRGAIAEGKGFLDGTDSTCYMLNGRLSIKEVPLAPFLRDMHLDTLETLRQVGLQGTFSGEAQAVLRFTPTVEWHEQSSIWTKGCIRNGLLRTPRFLRWFRPYYLAAYKDTLDFIAEIPELSFSDGFLRITDALLMTRVGALQVTGFHHIPMDRFLYRIQGARLSRKAQRYPSLEALEEQIEEFLDRSLLLVYVEKSHKGLRWYYPWRYLVRRLLFLRLAEPHPVLIGTI
ncbi:MAG: hypothetical protein RMJ66_00385 [Bacteroidia bacterium]|nr:hypothetical protein [Bacteroidia bacterium]